MKDNMRGNAAMRQFEPEPGQYEHHKGDLYDVIACATVTAGAREGARDVVYRNQRGEWFTRPVESWNNRTPQGRQRFIRFAAHHQH